VAGPALSFLSVVQSVFYRECAAVWCDPGWIAWYVADLSLSSVERGWQRSAVKNRLKTVSGRFGVLVPWF